jgi:GTP-binding protein Era
MKEKDFKAGFVALLGRPNVGKSTLLNALVGDKVSIISAIPQTTRHQIKGILNLAQAQIVFVDTPGIHSFKDKLTSHLNTIAKRSLEGCDLVVYVVDVSRRPGQEERQLIRVLTGAGIKTIMVLNKVDLGIKSFNDYIDLWKESIEKKKIKDPLVYYIPLSAKTGKNIDVLKSALVENLEVSHPYYDENSLTDFPLKFRLADIIREKLFLRLKKEVPHDLAVEIEEIEDKKKSVYIKVNIYVKRNSQKRIIVGKGGELLKEVGKLSREEIGKIYNKKVFLDTWVKVLEDWQERPRVLKELGYWWA